MAKASRDPVRSSRTSKACDRCRRQKLKCDATRPCILCIRADSKCVTSQHPPRRRARSQARAMKETSTRSIPRPAPHGGNEAAIALAQRSSMPDSNTSNTDPGFRTNISAIDFARSVFDEEKTGRSFTGASIPGDVGRPTSENTIWHLEKFQMPTECVMQALIDAYFHRTQWHILLFHEPSFRKTAQRVLSQKVWRRQDLSAVMAVLSVAAIGLQSVMPDTKWPGHDLLRGHAINAHSLLQGFIMEVRHHLLDVLEDCQIESVQIGILLSCFYVFHNSPNLAWTTLGMAVRAAFALDIQSQKNSNKDLIENEVRSRCWNHIIVADTFSSVIYGRPPSVDPSSVGLHQLGTLEDLEIDPWLLTNPLLLNSSGTTSMATFHALKGEIYCITRESLLRFRRLPSRNAVDEEDLRAIAEITKEFDMLLMQWKNKLPELFDLQFWDCDGRWNQVSHQIQALPEPSRKQIESIYLQSAVLQLTYDAAVIQIHRPLVEQRIHNSSCSASIMDAIHHSLSTATAAAMRISLAPMHALETHFAASFASLQQFTAGVILCIPPTIQPLTGAANEAKRGVMRIIRVSKSMSHYNRIARHNEQLLTELLKVTVQREMSCALGESAGIDSSKETPLKQPVSTRHSQPPFLNTSSSVSNSAGRNIPDVGQIQPPFPPEVTWRQGTLNQDLYNGALAHTEFPSAHTELPSADTFQQLDDTFGAFGELLFNLVPDDQSSSWNWGRTFQ
ncbi:hypothetical protein N7474_000586 [Penicillium riverlandense]|uniref:uncharacterized protein n=1 Tax=Penicillium riverlandense TaxID=1903569 RepID=UPI0025487043|nr:uncharacterized protein N7474_000586 [Penicillium riverlandense]KAJ5832275.1 hypothetical protein N7474_000586 [Penicillium riverlandense]